MTDKIKIKVVRNFFDNEYPNITTSFGIYRDDKFVAFIDKRYGSDFEMFTRAYVMGMVSQIDWDLPEGSASQCEVEWV